MGRMTLSLSRVAFVDETIDLGRFSDDSIGELRRYSFERFTSKDGLI